MNWKIILGWAAVLVLVAFAGVFAGRRLLQWQVDRAHEEKLAGLEIGQATGLRAGMSFPEVEITALTGQSVATGRVLDVGRHIVVFVSEACDACSESLRRWAEELTELPADITVLAITDGSFEAAVEYARRNELNFPLYVDEQDLFATEYGVDVIPTAMGIDEERQIRFVRHGIPDHFGLDAAVDALSAPLPH